jgi:mono/diheme cytochrome c family protein
MVAAAGRRSAGAARARASVLAAGASFTGLLLLAQGAHAQAPGGETHRDLVETYCLDCHNFEDWAGGVAFDVMDFDQIGGDAEVWEGAITKLRGRLMPPAGEPQPDQAQIDAVIGYLETSVDAAAAESHHAGHVPVQRLNRTEYAASVKGLIGVDLDPGQILPTEIEVEGFSNIADALAISPSFVEQYVGAAIAAARLAVGEPTPKFASVRYVASVANQTGYQDGFPLGTRGGMKFTHVFPADGEYRFNIEDVDAGLYPRGMETESTLVLLVDGREAFRLDLGGPEDLALADRDGPEGRAAIIAKVSDMPAQVEAGAHEITLTFIDRSWALSNDASGGGRVTRVPRILGGIVVDGPFESSGLSLSESRARIFVCQPATEAEERPCAEEIARNLATRAFRRPVTDADLDWLMPFYESGRAEEGVFDAGVRDLVSAILASPDFLYRAIQTAEAPGESRQLNGLEIASRLSFFLWSQGPDDELIALAGDGRLSDPAVMEAQVARMLGDPRAQSLVENFALAWLNLDELERVEPADPAFNAAMRRNFETEIRLFLASVLLEDRSVLDLLTADHTFVNDSLARHYEIPGVLGPQFRRVTLENENRWGLLGKGAVLLRTSYGDRTSPVLRGAWVLDRIMGTPPAPPPPNVETDLSIREGDVPTTIRARLEQHREDESCNACHGLIDPPGLALENFDVTGRWRDVDMAANAPIDATTVLTSGVELHGPADLRAHLTRRPDQFATTVAKRLMMYALNREVEYYDMPEVRAIVRDAAAQDYTLAAIITGIVNSDAFRTQGPEEPMAEEASLQSDTAPTP